MRITKTEITKRDFDQKWCLWALDEEQDRWIILNVFEDAKEAIDAREHYSPEKLMLLT
jgi:hypothetical protein